MTVGALKPKKVFARNDHDPFAVKTKLGWCINEPTTPLNNSPGNSVGYCHRISSKEMPSITPTSIIRALEMDFLDTNPKQKTVSQEDIKFLQILNKEILQNNKGHLEMPNSKTSWASQEQFMTKITQNTKKKKKKLQTYSNSFS